MTADQTKIFNERFIFAKSIFVHLAFQVPARHVLLCEVLPVHSFSFLFVFSFQNTHDFFSFITAFCLYNNGIAMYLRGTVFLVLLFVLTFSGGRCRANRPNGVFGKAWSRLLGKQTPPPPPEPDPFSLKQRVFDRVVSLKESGRRIIKSRSREELLDSLYEGMAEHQSFFISTLFSALAVSGAIAYLSAG